MKSDKEAAADEADVVVLTRILDHSRTFKSCFRMDCGSCSVTETTAVPVLESYQL